MKRVLTAAEMRAVDAAAPAHGVSSAELMERAGQALARVAIREADPAGRFFVLCGRGNNGGDGLVAARELAAAGRRVWCQLVVGQNLTGEPAIHLRTLAMRHVPLEIPSEAKPLAGDVIIDAIFGTGLQRAPEGTVAAAIEWIALGRAHGARVVAADLPSGLSSDTGEPYASCVTADVTLAFGFAKRGEVIEPGASRSGALEICDIGIPKAAESVLTAAPIELLEERDVLVRVPARRSDTHKGTYGHVLVVGGSPGKSGAAALTVLGALRGGAGLVTVAAGPDTVKSVLAHVPEAMGHSLGDDGVVSQRHLSALEDAIAGKSALVVGPGLSRDEETWRVLGSLLAKFPQVPVVLDADALNSIAGHLDVLSAHRGDLVLTPHPGEMARLTGLSTELVQRGRLEVATRFARDHRVTLILKGARSLVAIPSGDVFINPTGNPGMATGGTGDVLAGLVGAQLAQGLSGKDAALVGVWVHGAAGDVAKSHRGERGMIASDVLDGIGEVWRRWQR